MARVRVPSSPYPWIVLAFTCIVGACYSGYEAAAMERGWPVLSDQVRDANRRYPASVTGILFFLGALAGHLFWQ